MKQLAILVVLCALGGCSADFGDWILTADSSVSPPPSPSNNSSKPLAVPLTLIQGADKKGAVCLDGSLPGYHLDRGFGSGENRWLIHLEGGGWCKSIRTCVNRKATPRGSSNHMQKKIKFTGILSNKAEENPDFFNWNRVKLRYCDGASFIGDSQNEAEQLYFRGKRIFSAAVEDLMTQGMKQATQALLSGCSAGGLASILHCDQFKELFPQSTKVKCLSDAGMFMDAIDVSGKRTLREMYEGVVSVQDLKKNLPSTCTSRLDPTSCFFPQNLIADVKTPLFLLNAAYDSWQVIQSLIPSSADPQGKWGLCEHDRSKCNSSQIQFFQDFRNQMLGAINVLSKTNQSGLLINSCFTHCQSELQDTWFAADSPVVQNKKIAQSVGDWYFDRVAVKAIDCPFPCGDTCHNTVFKYNHTGPTDSVANPVANMAVHAPAEAPTSQSTRPTSNFLCLLSTIIIYALQKHYRI